MLARTLRIDQEHAVRPLLTNEVLALRYLWKKSHAVRTTDAVLADEATQATFLWVHLTRIRVIAELTNGRVFF